MSLDSTLSSKSWCCGNSARLRASGVARELFGDAFVDHYASTREWEQRQFDRYITNWELQRYFEII